MVAKRRWAGLGAAAIVVVVLLGLAVFPTLSTRRAVAQNFDSFVEADGPLPTAARARFACDSYELSFDFATRDDRAAYLDDLHRHLLDSGFEGSRITGTYYRPRTDMHDHDVVTVTRVDERDLQMSFSASDTDLTFCLPFGRGDIDMESNRKPV